MDGNIKMRRNMNDTRSLTKVRDEILPGCQGLWVDFIGDAICFLDGSIALTRLEVESDKYLETFAQRLRNRSSNGKP